MYTYAYLHLGDEAGHARLLLGLYPCRKHPRRRVHEREQRLLAQDSHRAHTHRPPPRTSRPAVLLPLNLHKCL